MNSFHKKRFQYYAILFISILTTHQSSGTRTGLNRGRTVEVRWDLSPPHGKEESNRVYGTNQGHLVAGSSSRTLHPEYNYENKEAFSPSQEPHSPTFTIYDSSFDVSSLHELDEIIDYPITGEAELPIFKEIIENALLKFRFNEFERSSMIDNNDGGSLEIKPKIHKGSQDTLYSQDEETLFYHDLHSITDSDVKSYENGQQGIEQSIDFTIRQSSSLKDLHEFLNIQSTDQNMVELVAGSGVMIDSKKLASLSIKFKYRSRNLVRELFLEMIPLEELIISSVGNVHGYKPIPQNIQDAVQSFVNDMALPKLNQREFMQVICSQLNYLQSLGSRKINNERTFTSHYEVLEKINEFPSVLNEGQQNSMVELIPGSGVRINNNKLHGYLLFYRMRPKILMRNLFKELIPSEELSEMRISGAFGQKKVPIHIRETVEAFIQKEAEPKLSHKNFMTTLGLQLQYMRTKQKRRLQQSNSSNRKPTQKTKINLLQKPGERLEFPPHRESVMVELVPKSKIMIDAERLKTIIKNCEGYSRELIRQLCEELIPIKELATMSTTGRYGGKSIPENVRNAVEEFVEINGVQPLGHQKFMTILSYHLTNLRAIHNF